MPDRVTDHISLSELQRQRNEWVQRNFGDNDTLMSSYLGASEEMGELAHHLLKRDQGIRGSAEHHTAEIRDAVCDTIIFLIGVATHEGFDIGEALTETWEQVRARDWVNAPMDGQLELEA